MNGDKTVSRLRLRNSRLAEELREANAALARKDEFLAGLSHEIRTSLNGMIGLAALQEESLQSEDQRQRAYLIRSGGENLLEILNSILEVRTGGKIESREVSFSLSTELQELTDRMRPLALGKGLKLSCTVDEALIGKRYKMDRMALLQSVTNLVHNAIKFTPRGHVDIELDLRRDYGDYQDLELRVRDTGLGIPKEELGVLFRPYARLSHSRDSVSKGVGLGLSLTQQLVGRMGAEMDVSSAPGRGSTFTIRLCAVVLRAPVVRSIQPQQWEGREVLVVDDDHVNLVVAKELLQTMGAQVDVVTSGKMALAAAQGKHYDMVLLDQNMDGMDGLTTAQALRENQVDGMIYLSSACDPEKGRELVRANGLDGFVPKPLRRSDLESLISRPEPSKAKRA